MIISYVMKYGTKWSKLSKYCRDRTEHNIKNRFFSLVSRNLSSSIRKIKESIDYRSLSLLEEILKSLIVKKEENI